MLSSIRGDSLVSTGTWPHWHTLKRTLSSLILGGHLRELASTVFGSRLPPIALFVPVCPAGASTWCRATCSTLALPGNFFTLLGATGNFGCFLMPLLDLRKPNKLTFSPPWPEQFIFLSPSHAVLATVDPAKLLPSRVLEERAQDQDHLPIKLALFHSVFPSFQPWTSTQESLSILRLASLHLLVRQGRAGAGRVLRNPLRIIPQNYTLDLIVSILI